jgi:hypothetical protein
MRGKLTTKPPRPFALTRFGSRGCPEKWTGPDRAYVTWTRFDLDGSSRIHLSYSDDRARSWSVPRANNDDSAAPANRDCGRTGQPACPPTMLESATGNDQWWPWVDISDRGDLNVKMLDRRLDTNSVAHEWPTSRQRPRNYLVWTWAAQCRVTSSTLMAGEGCVAEAAEVIPQPTAPIDPSGPYPRAGVHGSVPELQGLGRSVELRLLLPGGDLLRRLRFDCGQPRAGECPCSCAVYGRPEWPLVRRPGRWRDLPVAARSHPGVRAVGRLLRQLQCE